MIQPAKARRVRPDMPHYGVLPDKVMAWLEKDYPASATYWLFDG